MAEVYIPTTETSSTTSNSGIVFEVKNTKPLIKRLWYLLSNPFVYVFKGEWRL